MEKVFQSPHPLGRQTLRHVSRGFPKVPRRITCQFPLETTCSTHLDCLSSLSRLSFLTPLLLFPGIISHQAKQNHCFMAIMDGLQKNGPSSSSLTVSKPLQCDFTALPISLADAIRQRNAVKGQCAISEPGLQEVRCTSTLSFSILHHQTCSLLEYETIGAKPKSALLPKLRTRERVQPKLAKITLPNFTWLQIYKWAQPSPVQVSRTSQLIYRAVNKSKC